MINEYYQVIGVLIGLFIIVASLMIFPMAPVVILLLGAKVIHNSWKARS